MREQMRRSKRQMQHSWFWPQKRQVYKFTQVAVSLIFKILQWWSKGSGFSRSSFTKHKNTPTKPPQRGK